MTQDTRIDCATANAALEPLSALDRIRWAVDALADNVVLLSSMQKTAVVLMHLFHRLGLSNEVLFVDTGYHFFETLKMRDEYMRRYRLNVVTLYPASTTEEQETLHGGKLFTSIAGQPECCRHAEGSAVARSPGDQARARAGQRSAPGGGRQAGATSNRSAKIAARAATSCRRSTIGAVTTSARTSPSTACCFTRCTTRATRASAATRARRRSSPARTRAPAGGATCER